MKRKEISRIRQLRRKKRIRTKILDQAKKSGMPRLSVFRSNKYIYAQVINDAKGVTLLSASIKEIKDTKLTKINQSVELGHIIADKAKEKGIKEVVFDKGSYKYHGRIKSFAEAVREGGLKF